MTTATVHDILEQAKGIHHRLSEHYQQLAEGADRERVHMLLQYLQRHEAHMEQCVEDVEETAKDRVLNTWYQYLPDTDIQAELQRYPITVASTTGEILSAAVQLDQCLVTLYDRLSKTATSSQVQQLRHRRLNSATRSMTRSRCI